MALSRWSDRLKSVFGGAAEPPADQAKALTRQGVAHLDAGEYAQACTAFRRAIELEPLVAAHQVNLAYALQQTGAHELALLNLQRAVALDPSSFDARYMLAGELERDGDLTGASDQLRRAMDLRPDFVDLYVDLARVLASVDDKEAARDVVSKGLKVDARNASLHLHLGNWSMDDGDHAAALRYYTRADELSPGNPEIRANQGRALHAAGDYEEALESFRSALALAPTAAQVCAHMGLTLKAAGRIDDAIAALRDAISLDPAHVQALNLLGTLFAERGQLDAAIEIYQRALAVSDDLPGTYSNLGLALFQLGRVAEAVAMYQKGLAIESTPELHDNLGIALLRQGMVDLAIGHYRKALDLRPESLSTRANLAVALADGGGTLGEAIAAYREILDRNAGQLIAHSSLLFNMSVDPATSVEDYLREAEAYNRKLPRTERPHANRLTLRQDPKPLRVGLVSGDLRGHPVGYFIEGIVRHLDTNRVQLLGYPTMPQHDELTARIKRRFSTWRPLVGLTDSEAAHAIREDRVDILVDLSGHTADGRLGIFALRPAPVQVSWLGYFASTGVSEIDYILADELCVPLQNDWQFSEKVWRLPQTRLCFTAPEDSAAPPIQPLPALTRGHLTFGSFQRLRKINDAVLDLWGSVLNAIPDSRLVFRSLQTGRPVYAEQLLQRLEARGVVRERVDVMGPVQRAEYFAAYHQVDIVLDTFPFTGGTTTCEALWMGVPTLTLEGNTMISRQGLAMMTLAGLPNWVARGSDDLVEKAVAWSRDLPGLAALRVGMRERLAESPLFDAASFASDLADAFQGIWNARQGKAGAAGE